MKNLILISCILLVSQTGLAFSKKQATPQNAPVATSATVWVGKSDGALQCEPGSGRALSIGAEELKKAGIRVTDSKKTSDGLMRAQACGMASGSMNAFLIESSQLEGAKALGFQELPNQ